MRSILLAAVVAILAQWSSAQSGDPDGSAASKAQTVAAHPSGHVKPHTADELRGQWAVQRFRQWKLLERTNPKAYAERKRAFELNEKIQALLERAKTAGAADADKEVVERLSLLMEQKLKPELDRVDQRIACMEKHLTFLKSVRRDHARLIQRRIQELEGKQRREAPCE